MTPSTPWTLDLPLVADTDALLELGPDAPEKIADEDLRGSRVLLVSRTIAPIDLGGAQGGLVEFLCTFHPAPGTRFSWASVKVRLKKPDGITLIDIAPREVREHEPVKISVDGTGKLGVKYGFLEVGADEKVTKAYDSYHCSVQGSGASTALARWDLSENPHRREGIGTEQLLAFTLPVSGLVTVELLIAARLARGGVAGGIDAVRDLVLGADRRRYVLELTI